MSSTPAPQASSSRYSRSKGRDDCDDRSRGRWTGSAPARGSARPARAMIRWPTEPIRSKVSPMFRPRWQLRARWLRDEIGIAPIAVGHRVAHGGPDHDRPVLIDHGVVARLERLVPLAPLHQPHNLAPIRSILSNFPTLPQVACFDTAFHRSHGAVGGLLCHSPSASCRGRSALWIPWPFLRVYCKGPRAGCSGDREGPGDRRPSRQRRLDVRAERGAQRREHHGVHSARRSADGDASGANRSRCHPIPYGRKGYVRDERAEFPLSGLRLEGTVRHQQRHA